MKTFRRKKFWPAARLSSHVHLNPIRASSSRPRGDLGGVPRAVGPTLKTPKNCPTIGVHLMLRVRRGAMMGFRFQEFVDQRLVCEGTIKVSCFSWNWKVEPVGLA